MTVLVADGCGFILRGLREAAFFLIATAAYSTPIHVQTVHIIASLIQHSLGHEWQRRRHVTALTDELNCYRQNDQQLRAANCYE